MLTNEMIKRIHDNAVAHGFHEPDSEPTFGEYCALIHEEISEAFSAWRNGEPDEYVKDGKPEGVWVELADVVIRCADMLGVLERDSQACTIDFDKSHYVKAFGEYIAMLHYYVPNPLEGDWSEGEIGIRLNVLATMVYLFADRNGIDLDAIIERKHAYNTTRPWRHGKRM